MNIRCPGCNAVFRVDPARIPPAGIRARCSRCSAAFMISAQQAGAAQAPATPSQPATPPAAPPGAEAAPGPAAPPAATAMAPEAAPRTAPAAPQAGSPAAAAAARAPVFGTRDPQARAQRIARALVSDIVAYHPRKRDEALANGTLRTDFRDEIMKSWEEYVAQVGSELAKGTPYFRNALNEILAKGQRVF